MNHNYIVYSADGEMINRIRATEQFITQYCETYGYTYTQDEDVDFPLMNEPTEIEKLRADVDYIAMEMGVEL